MRAEGAMHEASWAAWLVAALLGGGGWIFAHIYLVSVETGSVFPRYSSLRSDPVGAKALYDSLAELPGFRVRRWFKPVDELKDADAVVLMLNEPAQPWVIASQKSLTEMEERAQRGLRLVYALNAGYLRIPPGPLLLQSRWRLALDPPGEKSGGLSFRVLDSSWKVLREEKGKAAAVERAWGKGSIVLVARSFPFSNQSLRDHRETALLAGALGDRRNIVFDEYHLGTEQTGSVGTLLRHFHLEAAAGVLALFGLLFAWRNSSSFLPPAQTPAQTDGGVVVGRDSTVAMTSLIRRSVPAGALPSTALELWRKSAALQPGMSLELRKRVEEELANSRADDRSLTAAARKRRDDGKRRDDDIPALWRRIHLILTQRT